MSTWLDRLRTLIEQQGTQDAFAEKLGVSQGWVAHKLSGRRKTQVDELELMASALGTTAAEILAQRVDAGGESGMSTLSERLTLARKRAGVSQAALAKRVGVNQSVIGSIEARGTGSTYLPRIAESLGVRSIWLADGRGPMCEDQQEGEWVSRLEETANAENRAGGNLHEVWAAFEALCKAAGFDAWDVVGDAEVHGLRPIQGRSAALDVKGDIKKTRASKAR